MKSKYDIVAMIKEAPANKEYYTVPELTELTGIKTLTIHKRIKDGTLKAKKISNQWRIYPESFNVKSEK